MFIFIIVVMFTMLFSLIMFSNGWVTELKTLIPVLIMFNLAWLGVDLTMGYDRELRYLGSAITALSVIGTLIYLMTY